ncbi:MAG: hypothetical protein EA362_02125 [Saprospirales bacterium]|nr:MAG: hypothetical protein EA362_02125 [Saprospirales bacterium]
MGKGKFKEERRFRNWEFYALLGFIILGALYRVLEQFVFVEATNWASIGVFTGIALIAASIIVLIYKIKLVTVVSKKGIRYQLYPLHSKKRKVNWDQIEEYRVVDAPAKNRFSGWNIYYNTDSKTYGFGETRGLYVKLKDGENLFLGIESKKNLEESIAMLAK